MAIRPYPSQLCSTLRIGNQELLVRPVRPGDEGALASFHRDLSAESVRSRYFHAMGLNSRVAPSRMARICHADYVRELALVVMLPVAQGGERLIAVARLSRDHRDAASGELAVVVADAWQHHGLGGELVGRLLAAAPGEGYRRLVATCLRENLAMQRVLASRGFELKHDEEAGVVRGAWRIPA